MAGSLGRVPGTPSLVLTTLPTVLIIVAIHGLARLGVTIPNPQLFLALAVCHAAFKGGWAGGMVSAAFSVANAVVFFSMPGEILSFSTIGLSKVMVNAITLPGIAALTATLSHRLAKAEHDAALSALADAETPMVLLDQDGVVRGWNRGVTRRTSVNRTEAVGRPLEHLVDGEDRIPLRQALAQALETGTTAPLALRFPMPGVSLDIPARLVFGLHPNRSETNQVLGVIMVGQSAPAPTPHPEKAEPPSP